MLNLRCLSRCALRWFSCLRSKISIPKSLVGHVFEYITAEGPGTKSFLFLEVFKIQTIGIYSVCPPPPPSLVSINLLWPPGACAILLNSNMLFNYIFCNWGHKKYLEGSNQNRSIHWSKIKSGVLVFANIWTEVWSFSNLYHHGVIFQKHLHWSWSFINICIFTDRRYYNLVDQFHS